MTTLERVEAAVRDLEGVLDAVRRAESIDTLNEARARVEAQRAWAKVHKKVSVMRLDLLRVEVEALVRLVALDGLETLPSADRKAAMWLAGMTEGERAALLDTSGTATTAVGMCKSAWNAAELDQFRAAERRRGARHAESPELDDNELARQARERVADVSAVLGNLIDQHVRDGQPFGINELADEVIEEAAIGEVDPAVREGVREVCRSAIRRSPIVEIDGTRLPRTITTRMESGEYVRIPVENALLGHFDEMRDLRRQQLEQDRAALDVLDVIASQLREIPGAADDARIGDLIARSISRSAAA